MKRLVFFICAIIIITSCKQSGQFEVSGTIQNSEDKTLVLNELLVSGTQEIESLKLDKKGNFKIKANTDIPKFYQLAISKNNFITLLIESGEKITIEGDAKDMSKVKISGSEGSILAQKINNQLAETKHKLDSILRK
ncbi:MAG: hypothetical protein C0597_07075 [Marinilabiliales bacterium]|nr:MAG: hypothetical protein C0597_07075 [Marinilabiliales bacterium]